MSADDMELTFLRLFSDRICPTWESTSVLFSKAWLLFVLFAIKNRLVRALMYIQSPAARALTIQ